MLSEATYKKAGEVIERERERGKNNNEGTWGVMEETAL